jgi:hypothetical protein
MKGFTYFLLTLICIISSSRAYNKAARYNFEHSGTWSFFPSSCKGWCYPHPDRFPVNLWINENSTCPDTIDAEGMRSSVIDIIEEDVCAEVNKEQNSGAAEQSYFQISFSKSKSRPQYIERVKVPAL